MFLEPMIDASQAPRSDGETGLPEQPAPFVRAARGAFSGNTERALRSDLAIYTKWCSECGERALPANPETVAAFVDAMAELRNPAEVIARLDKAREKYADMVLVHGGGPGVEKIAASWAERNGVHQIVCKPDWDRHGRAAPFRRNDELLNLLPKGVIAFPGSGITENLVDKARQLGIPVQRIAA